MLNGHISIWQDIFETDGFINLQRFPSPESTYAEATRKAEVASLIAADAEAEIAAKELIRKKQWRSLRDDALTCFQEQLRITDELNTERAQIQNLSQGGPSRTMMTDVARLRQLVNKLSKHICSLWNEIAVEVRNLTSAKRKRREAAEQERKNKADAAKLKALAEERERKKREEAEMLQRVGVLVEQCPPEILLIIYTHTEMPMKFQLTCKRWYNFSQSPSWKAEYLSARFLPYEVMFQAMARPRVFSSCVFRSLLAKEIPFPRFLVQDLVHKKTHYTNTMRDEQRIETAAAKKDYGPTVPSPSISWRPSDRWGSAVNAVAFASVIEEAVQRFGSDLDFHVATADGTTHTAWFKACKRGRNGDAYYMQGISLSSVHDRKLHDKALALYNDHGFMPFFTSGCLDHVNHAQALCDILGSVVCYEPSLAPNISQQGFRFDEKSKLAVFGHLLKNDRTKLLKLLDLNLPEWNLPIDFAAKELLGLQIPHSSSRWSSRTGEAIVSFESRFSDFKAQRYLREAEWELLMELQKENRLDFDLTELATRFLSFSDTWGCNWSRYIFVRKLVQDLPGVEIGQGTTFLEAVFFGLECGQVETLEDAHVLLRDRVIVTTKEIRHILLCNWTRSIRALNYAKKYVNEFDSVKLAKEILPALLEQPYKAEFFRQLVKFLTDAIGQDLTNDLMREALQQKGTSCATDRISAPLMVRLAICAAIYDAWRVKPDVAAPASQHRRGQTSDLSSTNRTTTMIRWHRGHRLNLTVDQRQVGFGPFDTPGFKHLGKGGDEVRELYEKEKAEREALSTVKIASPRKGKGKQRAESTADDLDVDVDVDADDTLYAEDAVREGTAEINQDDDPENAGVVGQVLRRELAHMSNSTTRENKDLTKMLLRHTEGDDAMTIFKELCKSDPTPPLIAVSGENCDLDELQMTMACRRQNIFGCRWSDYDDLWDVAESLLTGCALKCLKAIKVPHTIINCDVEPSASGITLTMDHFRLLAKLGRRPPSWMTDRLLKEVPDFVDSNEGMVFNTIEPMTSPMEEVPPFYEIGIVTRHRAEQGKGKEAANDQAESSHAKAGSSSRPIDIDADAVAPATVVSLIEDEERIEGPSAPANPMGYIPQHAIAGWDDDDDSLDGYNSYGYAPSYLDSDGPIYDSEGYEIDSDDPILNVLSLMAPGNHHHKAHHSGPGRKVGEKSTRAQAPLPPENPDAIFVSINGTQVVPMTEEEADRRAVASWRWNRAFGILLKEVQDEYTLRRQQAKEAKGIQGKIVRTRHSEFKKWIQKFHEAWLTESNSNRRKIMEQKELFVQTSNEYAWETEPASAMLELPQLLRERHMGSNDLRKAIYASERGFTSYSRHPLHRSRATLRHKSPYDRVYISASGKKDTILGMTFNAADEDDLTLDPDYEPPLPNNAQRKGKSKRKSSSVRWYANDIGMQRAASPVCSECDFPDDFGRY